MIEKVGITPADLTASARAPRMVQICETFLNIKDIQCVLIVASIDSAEIAVHFQIPPSASAGAVLKNHMGEFRIQTAHQFIKVLHVTSPHFAPIGDFGNFQIAVQIHFKIDDLVLFQ